MGRSSRAWRTLAAAEELLSLYAAESPDGACGAEYWRGLDSSHIHQVRLRCLLYEESPEPPETPEEPASPTDVLSSADIQDLPSHPSVLEWKHSTVSLQDVDAQSELLSAGLSGMDMTPRHLVAFTQARVGSLRVPKDSGD